MNMTFNLLNSRNPKQEVYRTAKIGCCLQDN